MCLAVAMIVAGVASLNNALPHIAEDLSVSQSGQQWVIDSYAVALAALLLPFGALGDRFGRRLTLLVGVGIFAAASVAAAVATSGGTLIAARAAMGVGAAFAMPGTLSTITSVFPPEGRAKAVGIWAGFAGAGGTIGMLMSGLLLERFWWGSTFLANALVAGLTFVARSSWPCRRPGRPRRSGSTPLGSLLSIVGIGAVVLGIIEGPERGWTDPVTLVGLIGGALVLAAFLRVELRTRLPLLDPRLFRLRGFATGSASLFLQFFSMFGFFFVSVQYLQLVQGYSALDAAVAVLPMSVVMIPLATVSATLAERHGQRVVGATGLALGAIGMLFLGTLGVSSSYLHLLAGMVVIAAGMALAMTPATNAIVVVAPARQAGRRLGRERHRPRARRRVRHRHGGQRLQHRLPRRDRRPARQRPGRGRGGRQGVARHRPRRQPGARRRRHGTGRRGPRGVHGGHAVVGRAGRRHAADRRGLRLAPRGDGRHRGGRGRARPRRRRARRRDRPGGGRLTPRGWRPWTSPSPEDTGRSRCGSHACSPTAGTACGRSCRNPDHAAEVDSAGAQPVVLDLESLAGAHELAEAIAGADAVVFAAGAGPGSGDERKRTVDYGGAVKLIAAAQEAGVGRYVMVSSIGADRPEQGQGPMRAYLQAKADADAALQDSGLSWTIVRPVSLVDEPGTGRVTVAEHLASRGTVPRDDVAAVLAALLVDGVGARPDLRG